MKQILFNEARFAHEASPYTDPTKANEWDAMQLRGSARQDLRPLDLDGDDVLADIGCGAGYHTFTAAETCRVVHAIDISRPMLDVLEAHKSRANAENVEVVHAGFLTADFASMCLTKAFSWGALHHLPDAWKLEALTKVADALPQGGRLLLMDLVFSFEPRERASKQNAYIKEVARLHGQETSTDLARGFESEFVTYLQPMLWILDKAGFCVRELWTMDNECWTSFLCVRRARG